MGIRLLQARGDHLMRGGRRKIEPVQDALVRFDKEILDRVVAQVGPEIKIGDGIDKFEGRAPGFVMKRNHRPKPDKGSPQKSESAEERQHSGEADTRMAEKPHHGVDGGIAVMAFLEEKMMRRLASRRQQLEDDGEVIALAEKGITQQQVGRNADNVSRTARHIDDIGLIFMLPKQLRVRRITDGQGRGMGKQHRAGLVGGRRRVGFPRAFPLPA